MLRSSNRFAPLATPDAPTTDKPEDPIHKPTTLPSTNELYIMDFPLAKLYTDDTEQEDSFLAVGIVQA
jgi:hypothetical protein